MANLGGRVVACLEARHAAEMADLVARHHGIVYPAPCLREVHEPDAEATRRGVDLLCGPAVDAVVFLTGVGVQTIVNGARLLGREQELLLSLAGKRIAARGPKAANAVRKLGLSVDLVAPEPFTSDALLASIAAEWDLRGSAVLVQLYGAPVPSFTAGLALLAARVIEVAPYRWERPLDEDAVGRLIEDIAVGWVDVIAATSAIQVDHLFDIARDRGYEADLRTALGRRRVLVAAQGIVCATAFKRQGIDVDLISPRASMGSLVLEIARHVNHSLAVESPPPPISSHATIAILPARDVEHVEEVRAAIAQLPATASVVMLAGSARKPARAVERAVIERGLSLRTLRPSNGGRHPADELVRGADAVLILTRGGLGVGRLLQLAERYAKPTRVVRCSSAPDATATA